MTNKEHGLEREKDDKLGMFRKYLIKHDKRLIISGAISVDESKVRQKSDKFCYFFYVNYAIILRKMLIINELEH